MLSADVEFYCTVAEVWAFTFDEVAEDEVNRAQG
jgi:hypothetical protein